MDEVEGWTAKNDLLIMAKSYEINETAKYPKMQHGKIDKIAKRSTQIEKHGKKIIWETLKNKRPHVPGKLLSYEDGIKVGDHYEIELEYILVITDKNKMVEALSDLDFWIINFISSFPLKKTKEHFDRWKTREIRKINNGYSTFCPCDHQNIVKEKNKRLINEKWKKEMIQKVNTLSEKFTCFQEVTLAKIPKNNKSQRSIANLKRYKQ